MKVRSQSIFLVSCGFACFAGLPFPFPGSNAVATLDTPFTNDPPTLADIEVMRAKVNELILAARR